MRTKKLELPDYELDFKNDIEKNRAIIISKTSILDNKTQVGIDGGVFSRKFSVEIHEGSPYKNSINNYSCVCGETFGKYYNGQKCKLCGSIVEERFCGDLTQNGWIKLNSSNIINKNNLKILSPMAFNILKSLMGKHLMDIISLYHEYDINGNRVAQNTSKSQYSNSGLVYFYKNFKTIMSNMISKCPKLTNIIVLQLHKLYDENRLFTSVIPILNPLLRPASYSRSKKELKFSDINKYYISIISNSNILRKKTNDLDIITINNCLLEIQESWDNLLTIVIESKLSDKESVVKSNCMSGRMTYSCRTVIVPYLKEDDCLLNNIIISYKAFIKMYTYEIINVLMEYDRKLTPFNAHKYLIDVFNSSRKNQYIVDCCRDFIKNTPEDIKKPTVIINRNPTFELGSVQCMKITDIFEDPQNNTMAVPLTSLKPFNADFDGDALNVWALKEIDIIKAFDEAFSPYSLIFDVYGGINDLFIPSKDQMAILYSFLKDDKSDIDIYKQRIREANKKSSEFMVMSSASMPQIPYKSNQIAFDDNFFEFSEDFMYLKGKGDNKFFSTNATQAIYDEDIRLAFDKELVRDVNFGSLESKKK